MMRFLTKGDKILISILFLFSICTILYSFSLYPNQAEKSAEVRVNGSLVKTMRLREGYQEEYRIGGQSEYAIIEVDSGKVRIRQDDSPRQIGVHTGWIRTPPQQIINLPYRIVVTVVSSESQDIDDIIR
ncbi:NusG domain II-containing protein [Anaerospora hongkongensis]|uniref:NusG domain II-containing protein n=1 Tax=Anaerospora hongkongensis TaxID=244830 RepID=UPI00289F7353|nr:NusG domain II-containing protein [Anaerospora hongkongensis]